NTQLLCPVAKMPVPVSEFPHYAGKSLRCPRQPLVHFGDPRPQRQGRVLVNALTVHRAPPVRVLAITHAHYCSEQPAPTRPLLVPPDQWISPLAPVSRPLPARRFERGGRELSILSHPPSAGQAKAGSVSSSV